MRRVLGLIAIPGCSRSALPVNEPELEVVAVRA
jgi:hypothetical protein